MEGSPYFPHVTGQAMERFEVKRGLVKTMGGNAGLARLATEHFNDVEVNADGVFVASFAILKSVTAEYTVDGKLQVDVEHHGAIRYVRTWSLKSLAEAPIVSLDVPMSLVEVHPVNP